MTCSHCGHDADNQTTFCSRCGTRFGPSHRSVVRKFLITRVARPWWHFIRESTMAFSILAGFYLSVLGVVVWIAVDNFSPLPTGFSSSMSASKGNFTKAIDAQLAKQCIEIHPGYWKPLPISIANDDVSFAPYAAQYNALVKAGLLSVTDTLIDKHQFTVSFSGFKASLTPKPKVPGHIYSLTDQGRRALENSKGTIFCAGHYQVDKITNFTMPGSSMGKTISEVDYTYSPSDVPAWALSSDTQAALPELAQQLGHKQQGQITLVLTNNGWQVGAP